MMIKKKTNIPKAIREQCWINYFGKTFEHSCFIPWCNNKINVFDFHVGHDLPRSKGGSLDINNIRPICARCNLSMSDNYTISEWIELSNGSNGSIESNKCNCWLICRCKNKNRARGYI